MISTAPPSLTISPPAFRQVVAAGDDARVTIFNIGKGSEVVTMNLAPVARAANGACEVRNGSAWGYSVSPGTFTLAPGHSQAVKVSFDKPTATEISKHDSPAGTQDLAILAATQAGHTTNGARVVAEVGAQALVQYPGKTPADAPKPCLALSAPVTPSGPPWALIGGLGAFLAALVGGGWLWRRRKVEAK